jgi:glycosyltransferase involved in cell wall biosynthesis
MLFSHSSVRIAFFTDILVEGFDGASRTMLQLIQRIPSPTFELVFITGEIMADIPEQSVCRIPTMTIPFNQDYQLALPLMAKRKIEKRLASFKPDIIHIATPSLLGQYALKYAKRNGLPVISIYHTHFISYIDYYLKYAPWLAKLVKPQISISQSQFYNQCSLLYVPSKTIFQSLEDMGIHPEKMRIWERGIDAVMFHPTKRNRSYITNLTGNDKFTILFASRLVWEKNLETLIQIYHLSKQMGYDWNFIIAGDGIAARALETEMPGAFFTGKLEHESLAELYASADVFLFPSVSETYGNVVAEAMASGIPIVLANGGGSRDLIEHGVTGFLCDPFDPQDYIRYLIQLQSNETLRQTLATAAHQASLSFNWDVLAERYCNDVLVLTHKTFVMYTNEEYASLY